MRTSTRIEVACARVGDATRVTHLASHGLLRARLLPARGPLARVALVQTAASLLSGDAVDIDVACEPGAQLELVEVAGLLAHDVRGGPGASLAVAVRLAAGARLRWDAKPLVLAAGCDLRRRVSIALAGDAVALLRDTLVLGRHGEAPGRFTGELVVTRDGAELHVEALDTRDLALLRSPVLLGAARALHTAALLGARGEGADVLQLHGPGSVLAVAAPSVAAAERRAAPVTGCWPALLHDGGPAGGATPDADQAGGSREKRSRSATRASTSSRVRRATRSVPNSSTL